VEIKTVPVETAIALYLNPLKLDPLKDGTAVLRQDVATAKLATKGNDGWHITLCEIEVRKNRITASISAQSYCRTWIMRRCSPVQR